MWAAGPVTGPRSWVEVVQVAIVLAPCTARAVEVMAANAPAAHRPHRPRASQGPPGRPARVLWCRTGPEVSEPFGRLHRTQLARRRLGLHGVVPGSRETVRGDRP